MKKISIIVVILLFSLVSFAQDFPKKDRIEFFNYSLSPGWECDLASEDSLPYVLEQIKSEFLWGARSQSGSYIIITFIDNTIQRSAFSAKALDSMISIDSFSIYNPVEFSKYNKTFSLGESKGGEEITIEIFITVLKAKGSGYDFQSSKDILTIGKTVYFPIVFRKGNRFFNYLVIASYRGKPVNTHDLNAFDLFYKSFKIPIEDYRIIDINTFNLMRAELEDMQKENSYSQKKNKKMLNTASMIRKQKRMQIKKPKIGKLKKLQPILDVY